MTVENQTNKTAQQVMGSSFTYDFNFRVLTEDPTESAAKEGIKVSVSNGTTTTDLTYGTDYSVALNSDGTGGTVTVVDKLTSDWTLIIYRDYDLTQGSDYNNYNAFPAETLERNLDKLTMITQQLSEENSRAVKVGMFSDTDPAELVNEIEVIYDHKTEVIAVANNITDVVAVSADLTNIDTVAGSIGNVNTVGNDIANVNLVAGDLTNVDTVAGIASDVSTVAGIATAVSNVSNIQSAVLNVSDDRANVNLVALNINNVNNVGNDIANVNTVGNDITNVDTVATNISNVNTAAANMTAIQNAPSAASNAASSATLAQEWATKMDGQVASTDYSSKYYAGQSSTSANNSQVWAEGTDVQVQALGGTHSAKVWAEQSTNANVDLSNLSQTGEAHFANPALTNSPYTTNRILEIPQDIKLELNNGTLTLKAGSKLYIPNGFEEDGVTPKFDVVINDADKSITPTNTGSNFVFYWDINGTTSIVNALTQYCASGTSSPGSGYHFWYDTTNNKIKFSESRNDTWVERNIGLPFCIGTTAGASGMTSIDQIFNGFGYIGSTVFALPGVKVQIPNGRNEDGTYRVIPYTTQNVITREITGTGVKDVLIYSNGTLSWATGGVYLAEDGYIRNHADGGINPGAVLAQVLITTAGKINNFIPRNVDSVANSNASNFSQAGRSKIFEWGMPDYSAGIDYTSSWGTNVTAPSNGFVLVHSLTTNSGGTYLRINGVDYIVTGVAASSPAVNSSQWLPVKKGDLFTGIGGTGSGRGLYFYPVIGG